MSYRIPTIIPKFRFWGAFIALTISSAIFVSSFTLIFSLSNAGNDIFGTSDNILVYYDAKATTPFTSNVPEYLEKSFQQVDGVELVNPEIFQPVIIGSSTAYIRGTNISKLIDLENGHLTKGTIPENNQIYHALVGEGLSNRLGLEINDTVTIESIVTDQHIPIRIVGKYESGSLATTDELLVSKEIARAIAGDDEFTVTHIRVKFDPKITTKEKIINEALKLYSLNLTINLGNNTAETYLYSIQIVDQANQIVFNSKVEQSFEINLFKGTYLIKQLRGSEIKEFQTIVLDSDKNRDLDLLNYLYEFDAWINYKSVNLPEVKYEIRETSSGFLLDTGLTDINGYVEAVLPRDNYTISVFEGINVVTTTFNLNTPVILDINIDSFDKIAFDNIKNGTLISKNNFILTISDLPKNLNLMFNNEIIQKLPSSTLNEYQFALSAENGIHEFHLIHKNNSQNKIQTRLLEIDSTIVQPTILDFQNGAHYEPSYKLNIDTRGLLPESLDTTIGQLNYLNDNITSLELPIIEGFYNFELSANDIFGNTVRSQSQLIVESNPSTGGFKEQTSQPIVKVGDKLDLWTNTEYEGITAALGSIEFEENRLLYTVPNLLPGNYSIQISPLDAVPFLINFTLVDTYSSLFSIQNESSSVPLIPNTTYSSSYFTLEYLNQSQIRFELNWEVQIYLGNGNFSLFSGQNVSVPGNNEVISSSISIKSKITETVEVIDVNFVDPFSRVNYLNLIGGFASRIHNGQISTTTPDGTVLSYFIERNNQPYTPVVLADNIIQLQPGNYSAILNNTISESTLIWIFEVPFAKELGANVNFVDVYYTWGILSNYSGELVSGQIIMDGIDYVVVEKLDLNLNYYRNMDNNSLDLRVINFIKGNMTIQYSNGTTSILEVINSNLYFPLTSLLGNTHFNITLNSISLTGKQYQFSESILLNLTKKEFTFTINKVSIDIIPPYRFTLQLFETQETISFVIDESNSTFMLSLLPQSNILTISDINRVLISGAIDLNSDSDKSFNYIFGTPYVEFELNNQNYNSLTTDGIALISLEGDDQNSIEISLNDEIQLAIGTYNFFLKDGNFQTSFTLEINNSRKIVTSFDVREITTVITINGLPFGDFTDFELSHKFLESVHRQQINTNENEISINSFPYGPSVLILNGSWGTNEIELNITRNTISLDLVIEGSQNIFTNIDFRFADKVGNLQLGASVGGEYLDSFLAGSLLIARSILITEIIIIFLIVISNVIEIFAALTYESKQEIAILRNLGSTTFQTVIASTKFLLLNAITISILGQLLGAIVIKVLLAGEYTVYFGHQFYPSLFVFQIFMGNVAIVIFLTFLAAYLNVRREYKMSELNEI